MNCRTPTASSRLRAATRRYGAAPRAHTIDSAAILFFGVVKTTLWNSFGGVRSAAAKFQEQAQMTDLEKPNSEVAEDEESQIAEC